ncbi:transcription termination factor Rho [Nocardioides sp. MAHUQ-72]|uniref:transcription termination factor Rho n=1 Tax=unclassified Nocardioides TaxID=2615069 RepID=UPI0036078818
MTETIDSTPAAPEASAGAPKKRGGGLNSMLIADLKAMAGGMGIPGAGTMKKAQLIEAIKAAQGAAPQRSQPRDAGADRPARRASAKTADGSGETPAAEDRQPAQQREEKPRDEKQRDDKQREDKQSAQQHEDKGREDNRDQQARDKGRAEQGRDRSQNRGEQSRGEQSRGEQSRGEQSRGEQSRGEQSRGEQNRGEQNRGEQNRGEQNRGEQNRGEQNRGEQNRDDQAGEGSRRNRRRRGRDRDRDRERGGRPTTGTGGGQRNEPDTTILEDDVLVPAAGILDVLDNYAFVRTSGYLPGTDDVYVSLSMVRKYGLRRGDAIIGEVRQPREGERKEKFNPMVRIQSVNGADPEAAKHRVEFSKLTPLYPSERLRLETEQGNLIGRVIDIAAPIGKGQRGLIVSPAKAGKTMIMQSIANSITTNNPECHLMVVLVDERPEEVTDFERSVKGEVISSTFDRPASDHTMVAELAIERAKRLVELGHDVVVLLDGITRLGRAYNLAAPASGRILSGGVDSAALYPPKRFFGAARNIENGGSLTILATALIESGSKMDEVIFEEFKGTGNMEIRLRRDFADKRLFPAIDAVQSGTRREELLMSKEELAVVWKLRRVLSGLDGQQALELLLERLKKSHSNIEFLMQVQKTTPTPGGQGD